MRIRTVEFFKNLKVSVDNSGETIIMGDFNTVLERDDMVICVLLQTEGEKNLRDRKL